MGGYDRKRGVEGTEKYRIHSGPVYKLGIWSNANPRGQQLNKIFRAHKKNSGQQLTT